MMKRYYWIDRAKSQDPDLAQFNYLNPRYGIIDRETNLPVDDANTCREAQMATTGWNVGAYDTPDLNA